MPKPRKHPKSARPVNRIFKDIRAKPLIWMSTPQIQETHNVMWQGEQGDARGPITHAASRNVAALSSFNIALENTRAPTPGTVHNSIGESPLGHCPFGNDNRGTSHQNQNHPNDCPCNPLSPIKTGGVYQHLRNGTDMVPDAPPTRPPEPGVYAVGVEVGSGTEPLCAIFNSQADYSCMIASVAERLPNVVIRNTTPSQRRKWYSTPAGQVFDPQRYAELDLKAFEPYIPRLKLSMLLLESDGPTDGVHIYLGGPVFRKLATLGVPLSVREMVGQSIGSGVMGIAVGYDETTEVPDCSTEPSSGLSGPFKIPLFSPPSFTLDLFSLSSHPPSTMSSFDSTFAPANPVAKCMKNPADDVFVGYASQELASQDGDLDPDTIDPALLSMLGPEHMDIMT